MRNEEARRILLDIADQMPSDVCADWIDAIGLGIKALEQQPSETIHGSTYGGVSWGGNHTPQQSGKEYDYKALWEQVKWERDIAIQQLEELGYSLGEKIRISDDLISRKALLREIGEEPEIWTDSDREIQALNDHRWFVRIVKSMPSVTSRPKWISVSERLPEEYKRVLVSDSWSGVYIGQYIDAEESWGGEHFINESGMHSKTVEAWQPLPEPYREDKE